MTPQDNMNFTGKVCVVSGGGSGIGFACAEKLAEAGARVFLLGRGEARLKTAADKLNAAGGTTEYVAGDLSQESEIERVMAEIERPRAV